MSSSNTIISIERVMTIVLLNKDADLVLENKDTTDERETFPSTPKYTDSPMYDSDDMPLSSVYLKMGPTKMRFVALLVASVASFTQSFCQTILSSIYEPALLAFPSWTSKSLTLLPIWGSVLSVVLVLPACMVLNKYDLKITLACSSCISMLGAVVRCSPFINSSTVCLHISAALLSAGGVVMTPLMVILSAQWFPQEERNIATGFGNAMASLGSAAAYVLGPNYVSSNGSFDVVRSDIMDMLYLSFGMCIFATAVVLLQFPEQKQPVSYSFKLTMTSSRNTNLLESLKVLSTNVHMWYLLLAFALANTLSSPWFNRMPLTFSKQHIPAELSSKCQFSLPILTFLLSVSMSFFADRRPGYSKEITIFSRLVALIFAFWLMLMMNSRFKMTPNNIAYLMCIIMAVFPYMWCCNSLLYEMGNDIMLKAARPVPKSFIAGYMTSMNNLFLIFPYVLLYLYPKFGEYWFHLGFFVCTLMSFIFLLLTKSQDLPCSDSLEDMI